MVVYWFSSNCQNSTSYLAHSVTALSSTAIFSFRSPSRTYIVSHAQINKIYIIPEGITLAVVSPIPNTATAFPSGWRQRTLDLNSELGQRFTRPPQQRVPAKAAWPSTPEYIYISFFPFSIFVYSPHFPLFPFSFFVLLYFFSPFFFFVLFTFMIHYMSCNINLRNMGQPLEIFIFLLGNNLQEYTEHLHRYIYMRSCDELGYYLLYILLYQSRAHEFIIIDYWDCITLHNDHFRLTILKYTCTWY